ncbi:MAG: efflux RND transporter periplasmic adaptor subunit [Acidobacteriaceae bacterium]|nr:efflux RND transporter periplasmic adaptor subunit [Acidobacteriaceae bacterium]MBV9781033.1 efflux RND transporter periplasmic adaptor subunit [Acidobacteriaceae bacterium]
MPSNPAWRRLRFVLLAVVLIAIVAVVVLSGILPRLRARQALREETNRSAVPVVTVGHPQREAAAEEVVLPGNIQAFIDAPIYARTSGYLKKWYADIGTHVKEGQLLADIEAPEVDQQLAQARADLSTGEANLKLSQITAARYLNLFKTDSVAKQDVDNAVQDAAAKSAIVKSQQANVKRLEELVSFERIYAPFDGVVTARNTDIGQLIDPGSSGGPNRELFHIASVHKLRVFINVPQTYSHDAVPGIKADLTLPELPGRRFPGTLVRTADAMEPATRTLLTEVDVVNTTGLLFPGAYTEAHLKIRSNVTALLIPATALIFRSEGLRAAILGNGNHARLVPITLGRDFGANVEVVSGLSQDASVILTPPDSLVDGEMVRIADRRKSTDSQNPSGSSSTSKPR